MNQINNNIPQISRFLNQLHQPLNNPSDSDPPPPQFHLQGRLSPSASITEHIYDMPTRFEVNAAYSAESSASG